MQKVVGSNPISRFTGTLVTVTRTSRGGWQPWPSASLAGLKIGAQPNHG
jgi:hypothetical protein